MEPRFRRSNSLLCRVLFWWGTGPSRWAREADAAWTSVRPELVCEVSFDHLQSGRFRHASRFLRWRPDKAPKDCDYDQLSPPEAFALEDILVTPRS